MISLPSGTRIWLVAGVTDMRKSFNGLEEQVQYVLDENPFSGHLFIFRGRRGDQIKVLWADSDGLCLFTKRLEPWSGAASSGRSPAMERFTLLRLSCPCFLRASTGSTRNERNALESVYNPL